MAWQLAAILTSSADKFTKDVEKEEFFVEAVWYVTTQKSFSPGKKL